MIGAIIVTHGNLADEIYNSAQMIVGSQSGILTYSIEKGTSPEIIQGHVESAIVSLRTCHDEILLLTDIFGGTPTNVCSLFLEQETIELISGVNLPMVIKFIALRQTMKINPLVTSLIDYGKNGIIAPTRL